MRTGMQRIGLVALSGASLAHDSFQADCGDPAAAWQPQSHEGLPIGMLRPMMFRNSLGCAEGP